MKKLFLACIASLSLGIGGAIAADMPVKAPLAPVAQMFDWSGWYWGIEGGGGWARSRRLSTSPSETEHFTGNGGLVGGTLGVNVQRANWVAGIESDLSWSNIKATGRDAAVFPTCTSGGLGVCSTEDRMLATVRGRLGTALGPQGSSLLYATGGLAIGNLRQFELPSGGTPITKTSTELGWTVGGGFESRLVANWSWKAEYLYVRFNSLDRYSIGGGIEHWSPYFREHIVRVGLNYKFGDPGWGKSPVVAKY